jgi:hypothetical protein
MSQVCSKSMSTQMTVQPYLNNTSILRNGRRRNV